MKVLLVVWHLVPEVHLLHRLTIAFKFVDYNPSEILVVDSVVRAERGSVVIIDNCLIAMLRVVATEALDECRYLTLELDVEGFNDLLLAIGFSAIILSMIIDTKYSINGNEFGVRYLYHWTWLPIDKIEIIKPVKGYMATAALSADRISIKFSDPSVLKSFAPIEISPKDVDTFISELIKINPDIKLAL